MLFLIVGLILFLLYFICGVNVGFIFIFGWGCFIGVILFFLLVRGLLGFLINGVLYCFLFFGFELFFLKIWVSIKGFCGFLRFL